MKYLTAIPVFLCLFVLDVLLLAVFFCTLGLLFMIAVEGDVGFPVSVRFANEIWGVS